MLREQYQIARQMGLSPVEATKARTASPDVFQLITGLGDEAYRGKRAVEYVKRAGLKVHRITMEQGLYRIQSMVEGMVREGVSQAEIDRAVERVRREGASQRRDGPLVEYMDKYDLWGPDSDSEKWGNSG